MHGSPIAEADRSRGWLKRKGAGGCPPTPGPAVLKDSLALVIHLEFHRVRVELQPHDLFHLQLDVAVD